jgi:hypothetical protein
MTMNHPSAIDLEGFACGEPSGAVSGHLPDCAACRAYVERARGVAREAPPPLKLPRAPRRLARAPTAVVPLAAAAAALFWMRTAQRAPAETPAPAPTEIAAAAPAPETTFKGAIQVAVFRERDGRQERSTGPLRVRPGDRLRVEVALDRSQPVAGAVLGDDGSFVELLPGAVRPAGTHLSERSVRIDARPMNGTILVGPPDAVSRARATGAAEGVTTLRLEWEPSP